MLFVFAGVFQYTLGKTPDICVDQAVPVLPGHWLCEAALWTVWENLGELLAAENGSVCALDVEEFAAVIKEHLHALVDVVNYARNFVAKLNHEMITISDMIAFYSERQPWHHLGA